MDDQALAYWYGRINYEQTSPQPDDLKLDRMRTLLRRLGDPQDRLRIVHVAGSKGKGSTSAMLAAILRQAGYRTGLFTSPHLCRVEERIQVDGQPISREELAVLLEEMRQVEGRMRTVCTFFEIATALGFLHFARRRVELAVVEVGLGGRFDSTNVCRPLVAVITSISRDHTQLLGDRLASIAGEKAGIIKPGRPTVSGVTGTEARQVIEETCKRRNAPLKQLGVDFHFVHEPGRVSAEETIWPRAQVTTRRRQWPAMKLALLGEHQAANAAVTVAVVEELRQQGMSIADRAIEAGLGGVQWPGRLEVLGRRPLLVLDCAHNVASAEALVDTLHASFPPGKKLLIFAVSNDKDVPGIVRVLAPHFSRVFVTRFQSKRSVPPEELAEWFRRVGDAPVVVCATPAEAWQGARAAAADVDLICATGSVFLAGELRVCKPCDAGKQPPDND